MQRSKSEEEIVYAIGEEATTVLIKAFGGLSIPIPRECNASRSHYAAKLIDAVGEKDAQRLCLAFADTSLYVPKRKPGNTERDNEIRMAYDGGTTVNELALAHDLTERRIRDILNSDN